MRKNTNWHPLTYNNYGIQRPLVNEKKGYTLLCNVITGQYVVAYMYNGEDNTWGQGHYFNDFHSALEFMYAPVE